MSRDKFPTFRRIGRGVVGLQWCDIAAILGRMGRWLTTRLVTRTRVRRLGMTLLVIFVVLAIPWTYFNITMGLKLERKLNEIRERGEPVTIEQAIPAMPPEGENAALIYNEIFRLEPWAFTEELPHPAEDPTPSLLSQIPKRFERAAFVPNEVPNADAVLRRAMQDPTLRRIFDLLAGAAKRPKCLFDIPWQDGPGTLFPQLGQLRWCARWLSVRVRIAAEDGHPDEAIRWWKVGWRVSEHVRQDPSLIGQLVSYAIGSIMLDVAEERLLSANISRSAARELVGETNTVAIAPTFTTTVAFERAWSWDSFRWMKESGQGSESLAWALGTHDEPNFTLAHLLLSPIGLPEWKYNELIYLRIMGAQLDTANQPYRLLPPETRLRRFYVRFDYPLAPLAQSWSTDIVRAMQTRDSAMARMDQFHIALALKLYKQERGEYPATLEALGKVAEWPIPDDIFSGKPFRYERRGEGYLLWSLGPDLKDDGGHGPKDEGYDYNNSDIVWRAEK